MLQACRRTWRFNQRVHGTRFQRFAMTFCGPRQRDIELKLAQRFASAATTIQVTNESHGGLEHESHFHVHVVSADFEGISLIERHRIVNAIFAVDGALPFHSLRITAQTPEQAVKRGAQSAPKCSGGDGIAPRQ